MVINSEIDGGLELAEMHYAAATSDCPVDFLAELIRKRAYQLFEAKGRRHGHELDDWLQAELEIKHHFGLQTVTSG